jgi:very-short-patch-repair endonuclease
MDRKPIGSLRKFFRVNGTPAERSLWQKLRNKQIDDTKFRRQQTIGNYIVDFVCFENRLVIEIDGGQHNQDQNEIEDNIRTSWLITQGFQVLRFWNNEVLNNLEGVIIKIQEALKNDTPSS